MVFKFKIFTLSIALLLVTDEFSCQDVNKLEDNNYFLHQISKLSKHPLSDKFNYRLLSKRVSTYKKSSLALVCTIVCVTLFTDFFY